jgi:hypothetical protein
MHLLGLVHTVVEVPHLFIMILVVVLRPGYRPLLQPVEDN